MNYKTQRISPQPSPWSPMTTKRSHREPPDTPGKQKPAKRMTKDRQRCPKYKKGLPKDPKGTQKFFKKLPKMIKKTEKDSKAETCFLGNLRTAKKSKMLVLVSPKVSSHANKTVISKVRPKNQKFSKKKELLKSELPC